MKGKLAALVMNVVYTEGNLGNTQGNTHFKVPQPVRFNRYVHNASSTRPWIDSFSKKRLFWEEIMTHLESEDSLAK